MPLDGTATGASIQPNDALEQPGTAGSATRSQCRLSSVAAPTAGAVLSTRLLRAAASGFATALFQAATRRTAAPHTLPHRLATAAANHTQYRCEIRASLRTRESRRYCKLNRKTPKPTQSTQHTHTANTPTKVDETKLGLLDHTQWLRFLAGVVCVCVCVFPTLWRTVTCLCA